MQQALDKPAVHAHVMNTPMMTARDWTTFAIQQTPQNVA
jgi:hypothetical protein